ncbi:unnamed protein product [Ranitomeya imitator]|uniref:AHNAK nucleoprotein n=1 Tax=Ranitomeya imitator TaxID=111125 RepID=A0ABN9KUC3_9NEOB|nr:unnamed protein product [Ranitomeya imitator]
MSSEDIEKLLSNVGQHTVGLKLQRKGDRSPLPGVTYSHDVFSLKSPDVVLSGDDEEYRRIYTKKIKPRLKSDESLEPETQTRTITVTRKVTAYTVDVTGAKDSKEIDISSPEYKIKIPRHEITEISKSSVETEEDFQFSRQASAGMHVPDISVSGPKFQSYEKKIDVKMSRFGAEHEIGFKGPDGLKSGSSTTSVRIPETDINISSTQSQFINITGDESSRSREIVLPGADIKMPKFGYVGPKLDSEFKLIQSSHGGFGTAGAHVDITPGFEGKSKTSKVTLTGQNVDIERNDIEVENSAGKINIPSFKVPKFGFSETNEGIAQSDLKLKGSTLLEGKSETWGVDVPKMSMPNVSIDTERSSRRVETGISGIELEHDLKLGGKFPEVVSKDVGIKGSKVSIEGQKRNVEFTDVEGIGGGLKMQKFNLSKFGVSESKLGGINLSGPQANFEGEGAINVKGPNVEGGHLSKQSISVSLPKISEGIDISKPKVNIQGPTVHMEPTDINVGGQVEGDKFKVPSVQLPKSETNFKGPTVEGNLEGLNYGIQMPKVDFVAPSIDLDASEGKLSMPKFKMPKFGISESNLESPHVDVNLPKGNVSTIDTNMAVGGTKFNTQSVNVSLSKVPVPEVDLSLKGPKVDGELKAPSFDIKGPKVDLNAADIDFDLKGPKISGDLKGVDLRGPQLAVEAPEANLDAPDISLKGLEGKYQMPKFKMPKFGISKTKVEVPDVDASLSTGKIDIPGPNLDFAGPVMNIDQQSTNIKLPKVSAPEVDLDIKGPKFEGDVKGLKVDIKAPDVDIQTPDVNLDGKVKGPKFKMPSVNLPKMSMPDFDINLKGPKVGGDLKGPKVDIRAPELDLEAPDVDLEGKVKGPKFKMPSVNLPKMSMPDFDVNLKGPQVGGDLKGPKVDISAPELDLEAPDVDLEGKVKGPKFKMPSVNLPKMSMPDFDVNLKGPKVGDLKGPKVDISAPELDLEAPDVDLEGKVKGPKFKMPSVNLPKMSMPDFDVNLKGPKVGGDLKGPKVDISAPELDLEAPDVDLEGKVKGPKFKMPSVNLPKMSMPDFDVNLKGPKVGGDLKGPKVDISAPELDLEAPDRCRP